MKKIFLPIALLLISYIGLSQIKVSFDYDKDVDFSTFSTYDFTEQALKQPINDINQKRLIEAITAELTKKELTKSSNPDLLIDIKINIEEKVGARTSSDYDGYGAWYGTGYPYRWGGGFTTSTIDVYDYMEGTVFIDLISTRSNRLVWQGRGNGTIKEGISGEKRSKRIKKGVVKIFKKYPPG